MKRNLISIIFILLIITTMLFSGKVMAADEEVVITNLGDIDISSIKVIKGTTPKYFEYENDQYTIEQEWYNSLPDPAAPNTQYLAGTEKITQFEDNYDTVYTCRMIVTPKTGYKFEYVPMNFFYGVNFLQGVYNIVDGKCVLDIFCKASVDYKVTINSESSNDVIVTMDNQTITKGKEYTVYSHTSNRYDIEAKEGYAITKVEYETNGEKIVETSYEMKEYGFYLTPEDNIEIKITTEPIIQLVEVTGLKYPIIRERGENLELKVPDAANYEVAEYYWYNISDDKEMAKDEKFEIGTEYSLYVVLRSDIRFTYYDIEDFSPFDTCKATLDSQPAKVESVNKEDTKYYLTLASYPVYAEAKEYNFIDNTNEQTYTRGKDKTLTFKIDADYSLFNPGGKVYIDGDKLEEKYYTHTEGSTVITLTEEFMYTLELEEHFIEVEFSDYGYAITTFTISEKDDEVTNEGDKKDENTTTPEQNENTGDTVLEEDKGTENTTGKENKVNTNTNSQVSNKTNPQTGDNIELYFIIFIISIAGIVAVVIKRNKK